MVDVVHGVAVADPYRWLEDDDAAPTVEWARAQNRRSRTVLDALPQRAWARRRFEELLRAPVSTGCRLAGGTVFALERSGARDQAVLVVRSASDPHAEPVVLIDPNGMASDEAVAIDWYHPSPDGRLVAYGLSEGGDERSTLRVLDVGTAVVRPDVIPHTRAASVAWLPDGSAFAYTRYPDPAVVGEERSGYDRHVRWHVVGDDPTTDAVVLDDLADETAWPDVSMSRDGRWLVVHVSLGWSRTDVHLLDRLTDTWTPVVEGEEAVSRFEVVGDRLVGHTTLGAPRGRVVAAPLADPRPGGWATLVAEGDAVVDATAVAGATLLVASSLVAVSHLHGLALDASDGGGPVEIPLPGAVSIAGLDADPESEQAFLQLESFARPAALHRWTPTGVQPWAVPESPIDPDAYLVEHVGYPSTDGTEVPMFLVRRRDATPGPEAPAVLTGYGGFAIANGPAYSPAAVATCDAGGTYAVAGIRGGLEHGEAWHQAGMRRHKQQVFDDFCAAADWLVETGVTTRRRLAIRGGSNGGLLVGAAITQRPDLCRAAICAVPLLDMVRFPRFLIARLWVSEYGDPEVAEEFAWLHAYSPYHRVLPGTCYPAVILMTAEGDSRVHPGHARKMGALLQAATSCGDRQPVLVRIESRAGHGAGKPVGKQADEAADALGFVLWQLGVEVG